MSDSRAQQKIDALILRISEAMDHVDQTNTIFSFAFLALSGFSGFSDAKLGYKLEAMINVSNILDGAIWSTREEAVAMASQEIVSHRLPALLVISLVSAVETCLEDLVEINLRYEMSELTPDARAKRASKAVRGGPSQYLPSVAEELGVCIDMTKWSQFEELVATRNVLVHESRPIADAAYVKQAGGDARAKVGESVMVDNSYLITKYAFIGVRLLEMIQLVNPAGSPGMEYP